MTNKNNIFKLNYFKTYNEPTFLRIVPVTQWAAVKIYLDDINVPPHENIKAPVDRDRYCNKTIQGNSSKLVTSPPSIRSDV